MSVSKRSAYACFIILLEKLGMMDFIHIRGLTRAIMSRRHVMVFPAVV